VKIQVHFPDDWDKERTYTYEAPDDTRVGDIVAIPVVHWLPVVALGSDYTGPCKPVREVRPAGSGQRRTT
jgi:hypothetical protein